MPDDIARESDYMIAKYKMIGEQITKNDMMKRRMGIAMSKCYIDRGNEAANEIHRRMQHLSTVRGHNEALKEFTEMTRSPVSESEVGKFCNERYGENDGKQRELSTQTSAMMHKLCVTCNVCAKEMASCIESGRRVVECATSDKQTRECKERKDFLF